MHGCALDRVGLYLVECLNGCIQRTGQAFRFGRVCRVALINAPCIGQIRLCSRKDVENVRGSFALDRDGLPRAVCHRYRVICNCIFLAIVCDCTGRITCDGCRRIPFDNGARASISRHFIRSDFFARNRCCRLPLRIGDSIGAGGNLIGCSSVGDCRCRAVHVDRIARNGAFFDSICTSTIFGNFSGNAICSDCACTGGDRAAFILDCIIDLAIRHRIGDILDINGTGCCDSICAVCNRGRIPVIRRTRRFGDSIRLGIGDTVIPCMGDGVLADIGGIAAIRDRLRHSIGSQSVIGDALLVRLDTIRAVCRLLRDCRRALSRTPFRIICHFFCTDSAIAVGQSGAVGQFSRRLVARRRIANSSAVDSL